MTKQVIFDKKNILVIGGAGFIGSNLIEHLLPENKVICIDNFITGSPNNIDYLLQFPDFALVKHDMNNPINLEELNELKKFRIEWQGIQDIIYLACPTSYKDPKKFSIETITANSTALKNALDLAVKYNARFLFGSSSAVYGDAKDKKGQIDETYIGKNDNFEPRAAYNEGKRFAETMVYSYFERYNLDVSIARIFSTYGPRMILNDGRMIPDFIDSAMEDKDIIINGDKKITSSFCYITDLIDGMLKLMDNPHAKPLNLGNPEEILVSDVAKKIIELTNSKSKIVFQENFQGIQRKLVPDISQAKEILGWLPMTKLDTGLKATIEHIQREKAILSPSNL